MRFSPFASCTSAALACVVLLTSGPVLAQGVNDSTLIIDSYVPGLSLPTGMRFFGSNQAFLIEKETGQVKLFNAGSISTVLDLPVQGNNERGLLGIAIDPAFATNQNVYLYYSSTAAAGDSQTSADWTGNQLVKYQWNGSTLTPTGASRTFGSSLDGQANGPNHNGGPLTFGLDGKLYGVTGDLNRNGVEQNNQSPTAPAAQVGGVYRLNTDLTSPTDNPFTGSFAQYHAYGIRNSFGLAVDPATGNLWETENGPDSYDEINLVASGMNGGWNKIMGPDDMQNAPGDLNMLPGASYSDPELSFLQTVALTSIQFLYGSAWGPAYDDAVIVGDNNTGRLYLLRLNATRTGFLLPGDLTDLVADNSSEASLLAFGQGFGVVTDLQIGLDGALYVTSLSAGTVYRIAPVPVPEAQTWVMLAVGVLVLSVLRGRRPRRT